MEPRRYVIVGGSAAGMAAAGTIRAHDPEGSVRVVSDEADPPYFRPLIPYLVSQKKTAAEMFLQGQGPYRAEGIELALGVRAERLDCGARQLITAQGEAIAYDRLLIATGSHPYIPHGLAGLDHPGVFALRSLADARLMARRAEATSRAVMLGGGLLNLKAAFALLKRGIAVTLVVHSPEILSQLMESADALLLRRALDRAGLQVLTGRSATAIVGDDRCGVTGVVLDDGRELACQMVCIGKGVRPNNGWLDGSGIRIERGVVVDRHTATDLPDVYAAGDVAVTYDPITGDPIVTGLWTNAVEMGRCAGTNMAGHPSVYSGTFGILNATEVARVPFVSMGIVHTTGTTYETWRKGTGDRYRKLVFSPDGERLVGALFVGDITNAGLYRLVIRERMAVGGIKRELIEHRLHYGHLLGARVGR